MTEKEIELAMDGLFRGASKVRASKYAKEHSGDFNRELTSRIAERLWEKESNI